MTRIILYAATAALLAVSASCSTGKAAIDYTMADGIVYPGPPEKPRIKYLWSLSRISGVEGAGRFASAVIGTDPVSDDPRDAETLQRPHGVYVDARDIMYMTDPGGGRVAVVDLKSMESFKITTAGDLALSSPISAVSDAEGRIYVSDSDLRKVAVYDKKGGFLYFFKGEFKRPTGMAVNLAKGLVYVCDTWAHMVYVYGLDGQRKGMIGGPGESTESGKLNYPTHAAVDPGGGIYVSDTLNFRVQMFTETGKYVHSFGVLGDSVGSFDKIKGIAVDSGGHIYVADSAQDMVKIYNKEGRLLLYFGQKGRFYGMFMQPSGLFIDTKDRIYVSDSLNGRVQAFQFLGGD